MGEIVDLMTVRRERERQTEEIDRQRLEEAARLVVRACALVGPTALGGLCDALDRRLG